jgi:hypothetical protein
MNPQQKALPGSYYAKLIAMILSCILCFAEIFMEIFDIFHPFDIVPINAAIHLARITFVVLGFIIFCGTLWYLVRFERAKALGKPRAIPQWILFLNRWALIIFPPRWTWKSGVNLFILFFTGSVIFQILTPYTTSPDIAWKGSNALFFATLITFTRWIRFRKSGNV